MIGWLDAFNMRINKTETCWLWTGDRTRPKNPQRQGYGRLRGKRAHRLSWELFRGPIPPNLCVCHACDTPPCVRPEHLYLGTLAQNNYDAKMRGLSIPPPHPRGSDHYESKRTHCPHGHPYSGENLKLTKDGHRECYTCARKASREYAQRKRDERRLQRVGTYT